jgi:hypothetical protein
MLDGVHIVQRIHARGALLKVLDKPHLDLSTPIGRGFVRRAPRYGFKVARSHRATARSRRHE